jgi:hypothetical protein
MKLGGMSVADLRANVREAEARVQAALSEYEAAKAELAWWQAGLRLLDPEAVPLTSRPQILTELFPEGIVFETGARPTLRQAIALVIHDAPSKASWTIPDIAQALDQHGWLPAREDATKGVSDMAAAMYNAGQLSRLERGVYKLAPPLEAALDTAEAQPVTDYQVAARLGFPVPERRNSREE